MTRLFVVAALATLAAFTCRNFARQGRSGIGSSKPEPLQRWEDEGGGVPATATQTVAQVPPGD